ncbi:MAG: CBS domain-containing protein [Shimia sp.]
MRVSDILRTKSATGVVTLPPTALVSEAAKMLAERRIGTVVISSDGRSADGILSERDIVREIGQGGADCLGRPVSTLMTTKLVTTRPDAPIEAVLESMTEGRFRHMPVLDDGALVGLVSLGDVVKAQLAEVAREKEALTSMIMGHG